MSGNIPGALAGVAGALNGVISAYGGLKDTGLSFLKLEQSMNSRT